MLTDKGDSGISPHDWHLSTIGNSGRTEETAHDEHDECGTGCREQEEFPSTDPINDERTC